MDIPRSAPSRRRSYLIVLVGALLLAGVTVVLSRLASAPPSIDRSSVWIDTVKYGSFVREVSGPGTLVPEEIRWITADSPGRVERIHVAPGSAVAPDTVLVELSNPDLELKRMEADLEHQSAQAAVVNLKATVDLDRLKQKSIVEQLRVEYREAQRRADAYDRLFEQNMVGELEHLHTLERAEELGERLAIERERVGRLEQAAQARLQVQTSTVERLAEFADFRKRLIEGLMVRAETEGVLQELPLEVGQRVQPGQLLAKVVQPTRLKAELRIPEARAKEIQLGQKARIDAPGGSIDGHVVRIDPAVQDGTVTVDVALEGELPRGARPDLSVEGRIELEHVEGALFTGRPVFGQANRRVMLFKLEDNGDTASRVRVRLGGSSASEVEIREGLEEGDRIILSDMSAWDAVDRVALH